MATKTTKSRTHSSKPTKIGSPKTEKRSNRDKDVDVLGAAAVQNLYYVAHNAAACLELRGYGLSKDKRKKRKRKRKKKK